MKKKILSMLLVLCLAVGMLPAAAYAESGQFPEGWTELNQKNIESYKKEALGAYYYELPSGNYYLGGDILVDTRIQIGDGMNAAEVTLDLNGHELKNETSVASVLYISCYTTGSTAALTLQDSSEDKTGKVISNSGEAVKLDSKAALHANGGTVDGLVYMDSGNVVDNTDPSNVTVFKGPVTNWGTISGGIFRDTVENHGTISGGIFYGAVENYLTISGGIFYGAVTNNYQITGGTFYGTISGSGTVSDNAVIYTKLNQTNIEDYRITTSWSDKYFLPSGNYYLGDDISVDTTITIGDGSNAAEVTLDLNGYTLKNETNQTSLLHAVCDLSNSTTTLTLIDSSEDKTGKVINSYVNPVSGTTGYSIHLTNNTKLNANGGTVGGVLYLYATADWNTSTVIDPVVVDNTDPSNVTLFTGAVKSYCTINAGIFDGEVTNTSFGTINGGTFNGTVNNEAVESIINGGTFNSTVNNNSGTITDGTFNGTVNNKSGYYNGTITGGIFNGDVVNAGIIQGGIFYGAVSGDGTIEDSAKVTVTFDSDGGSTVQEEKVLRGQKATIPTAPTKAGYTFEGWYNGDATSSYDFENTPVIENIALKAKWVKKPHSSAISQAEPTNYTVEFETNGGSSIAAQTVAENGLVTKPAKPTKEGYIFDGWYKDKGLSQKYDFAAGVTADLTLYAKWSAIAVQQPESKPTTETWQNPFSDVSGNDWFYGDVAYVHAKGLMAGTSMTEFSPNATTTRGMVVTILYRLEGSPAVSGACPFADVAAGAYYEDAAAWAAANGIAGGYGNGIFGPNDPITREQLAAFLYRYAQYKGIDVSVGEDTNILSYNDALEIDEWAFPAMQWICGAGIMGGSDGNLMPTDSATRAQLAALLHRFCENVLE